MDLNEWKLISQSVSDSSTKTDSTQVCRLNDRDVGALEERAVPPELDDEQMGFVYTVKQDKTTSHSLRDQRAGA
jgi:hypothetical protein